LVLSAPLGALADDYDAKQVQQIANLLTNSNLSATALRIAIKPLVEDHGASAELIQKLQDSRFSPKLNPKQYDVLIDLARRAVGAKAKAKANQQQAAAKAGALANAHASATTAHTEANAAAVKDQAAHADAANAPADSTKAAAAAQADQDLAAANQKAATADAAPELKANGSTTNTTWSVLMWTGAKMENPYSITNGVLKPNNNSTVGFIELELIHRYVLDLDAPDNSDNAVLWGNPERQRYGSVRNFDFFVPSQLIPDFDLRVGYVFTSSSSVPTNLTVATIAGGSDLSSDVSIGVPIWRWTQQGAWAQQATIELGGGFVTDKEFLAIHPNVFMGLGYQFHNQDWTWQTRFGFGGADVPVMKSGSNVATNSVGLPQFDLKLAPSWGTTLTYKLSSAFYLQMDANAYFDSRATWNLSAGVSIDPAVAFKGLMPK
jgi:hypothetical protein